MTYYVGSTINYDKRLGEHKCACNNINGVPYNYPLYTTIRNNGGFSAWTMEIIQSYPECKTDEELRMHEREHYDLYNPPLNVIKPYLSKSELAEYRAKYQLVYQVNYKIVNKDELRLKRVAVINCPCGSNYQKCNKLQHFRCKKHQKHLADLLVQNQ
jgi:hypothetical protein